MGGSTWQTVKGTQKARKTRGPLARGETMRQQLAKELVVSLFSKNPFSVLSSDDEEPEWTCKECGMFNFATRKKCRRCGDGHGAAEIQGGKGSPASTQQAGKGPSSSNSFGESPKGGTPKAKRQGKGKGLKHERPNHRDHRRRSLQRETERPVENERGTEGTPREIHENARVYKERGLRRGSSGGGRSKQKSTNSRRK